MKRYFLHYSNWKIRKREKVKKMLPSYFPPTSVYKNVGKINSISNQCHELFLKWFITLKAFWCWINIKLTREEKRISVSFDINVEGKEENWQNDKNTQRCWIHTYICNEIIMEKVYRKKFFNKRFPIFANNLSSHLCSFLLSLPCEFFLLHCGKNIFDI